MVDNVSGSVTQSVLVGSNMCCMIGGAAPGWQAEATATRSQYFYHLYFTPTTMLFGVVNIGGLPPDPEMWYRDDWFDALGVNDCKASYIAQSRYDRYEIYSAPMRQWTTALDTEQALFSFQTNTDASGNTWTPNYRFIRGRTLLAAGACDDYDNAISGASVPLPGGGFSTGLLVPPTPVFPTGTCGNNAIGNTGANVVTHEDINGYTHDVANDMQNAAGKTLFLNDTGHSIHDERPIFFAGQILTFLASHDNNVNITLVTNDDDVRWNSEVHAQFATVVTPVANPPVATWSMDIPLNYWFHDYPAGPASGPLLQPLGSPDNPCGVDCTKLNTFDLEQHSTHTFTVALPDNVALSAINSFSIALISGFAISPPGSIGYGNDKWNLQAIAACPSGGSGSFVSDGFTAKAGTTLKSFQAGNYGWPPIVWTPPTKWSTQEPKNS